MTAPSRPAVGGMPGLRPRMHILLSVCALLAVALQIMFRVPGSTAVSVIPLLSLALSGMHALLIVKAVLWGGWRGERVPAVLLSVERASAAVVLVSFSYGVFLLANARLYSSPSYYDAAEVTGISGGEDDFRGVLPYGWADLRFRASGRVERILLRPYERRALWGGQAVEIQLRRGYFNVPWITHIGPDRERENQAVLREAPAAASALYALAHLYLARQRWEEGAAMAIQYVSQYPDNRSVARHFGELLEASDRFAAVVAVLEPVRRPDYDVLVLLGRALAQVNRVAEAITLLERASRVQPGEPDAYRDLGMIHSAAGDTARAIRMFEKVLELQPRSPDVRAKLRRLRTGQPD
jgi:tetratricopeptide (TPR) repeat protein